jgi:hypothetical protein
MTMWPDTKDFQVGDRYYTQEATYVCILICEQEPDGTKHYRKGWKVYVCPERPHGHPDTTPATFCHPTTKTPLKPS